MKRRFLLIAIVSVAFGALSFACYNIVKRIDKPLIQETKKLEIRTDKFALKELIAVVKKYKDALSVNAEFTTSLIAQDGKTVITSFDGRYIKDSSSLYIKSFGSENLVTSKFVVAIDDDEQMMFVEKPEFDKNGMLFQSGFLLDIDSIINLPDSLVYFEKIDSELSKLTIELPSGSYYKSELFYNTKSKNLVKIHLFPYDEIFEETQEEGEISDKVTPENSSVKPDEEQPLFIELVYNKLEINKPINKKWFDEKRYFSIVNNDLVLNNSYKNYEVEFE